MAQRFCAYCGKPFVSQRSTAKYCCDKHRNYDRRRRKREEYVERQRAAFERREPVPMKELEISDEMILSYFADLKAVTSALLDASNRANPHLRLLCGRVGSQVRDVLDREGLIDG